MKGNLHPLSFLIRSSDGKEHHSLDYIKSLSDKQLSSMLGQAMKNLSILTGRRTDMTATGYVEALYGDSLLALAAVYDAACRERAKRAGASYSMDQRLVQLLAEYMMRKTTSVVDQVTLRHGRVPPELQRWFEWISMSAMTGSMLAAIRPDWWK